MPLNTASELDTLADIQPLLRRGLRDCLIHELHAVSGDLVKQLDVRLACEENAAAALGEVEAGVRPLCGVSDDDQLALFKPLAQIAQILRQARDEQAVARRRAARISPSPRPWSRHGTCTA